MSSTFARTAGRRMASATGRKTFTSVAAATTSNGSSARHAALVASAGLAFAAVALQEREVSATLLKKTVASCDSESSDRYVYGMLLLTKKCS